MYSTLSGKVPDYIGADLTDRYSVQCRDIDVCGLTLGENKSLHASFWYWKWDPAHQLLDVRPIVNELASGRVAMADGSQALARDGAALRACERQSAAVAKTPDTRPLRTRPFAGFIWSSLDLFSALIHEGVSVGPPVRRGSICEVYPGHIWSILFRRRPVPLKRSELGRLLRKRILESFGVCGLPELPTHDQNDACIAALLGALADNQVAGASALAIGESLFADHEGTLREGQMMIPELTAAVADRITEILKNTELAEPAIPREVDPQPAPADAIADELLDRLVAKAIGGAPQVCTYAGAYRLLFQARYSRYSQAYTQKVLEVARRTRPRELPGLGLVTFIVSKTDRRPSEGYWPAAHHDQEDWVRNLGNAQILE